MKRALVVEGGGLRGAFAVGVLKYLFAHVGPEGFDRIIAVSSGVFASTFFTSRQVDTMENTWRHLVHGSQMINYLNPLKGRSVLDLDHLIDLFKGPDSYLDVEKVMQATPDLYYVLTDFRSGKPVYVNAKRDGDIFQMMKASAALPVAYNIPVWVNSHPYCDGGISDSIPIDYAISEGFDEILVILTRTEGGLDEMSLWERIFSYFAVKGSKPVWKTFLQRPSRYNHSLQTIYNPPSTAKIHAIWPVQSHIHRLERSQSNLTAAIEHGKEQAKNYINSMQVLV